MAEPGQLVVIGKLGRPRGVRGMIYVNPTSDQPERFLDLKRIFVSSRDGWEERKVESSQVISGRPTVKFEGINSPEEVARLTNRELALPREELIDLPTDTFFVFELVGCKVYDEATGEHIGEITEVKEYPSSDIYVIARTDGSELLCPAVKQFVTSVDIAKKKVMVAVAGLSPQE